MDLGVSSRRVAERTGPIVGSIATAAEHLSAARVAILVAAFYALFTLAGLIVHRWDPLWFGWLGDRYSTLTPGGKTGYDGQFVYYIARDGAAAIPHLDTPPYRMQRILLPALARLLALGHQGAIPWLIVAVNFGTLVGSAYVLGRWLTTMNLPPVYAVTYSLYVGSLAAYARDLTEPLAFLLAGVGTILWMRQRHRIGVVALALAALTKETTILFIVTLALGALIQRRWLLAAGTLLAALPLALWEAYLYLQFRQLAFLLGPSLAALPLSGSIPYLDHDLVRWFAFLVVGIPAAALTVVAGSILRQHGSMPGPWLLLGQAIFVLLFPPSNYDDILGGTGRNAAGLVLAAVLCLPLLGRPWRLALLGWWVIPTLLVLPSVLRSAV